MFSQEFLATRLQCEMSVLDREMWRTRRAGFLVLWRKQRALSSGRDFCGFKVVLACKANKETIVLWNSCLLMLVQLTELQEASLKGSMISKLGAELVPVNRTLQ